MKRLVMMTVALWAVAGCVLAQEEPLLKYEEPEVLRTEDVVFRQIDEHTWVGNGHLMYYETLYLVEGEERAVLLDAGTEIRDLDKIVAQLTSKPVTLIATHVHPDHTGSAVCYWPEIWINPADTVLIPQYMPHFKGRINYLREGEVIDLGGRQLEVVFTPGHTPGSTSFMDVAAGYGFSADAFGSGGLMLFGTFSTLIATCQKTGAYLQEHGIRYLYPGHYTGWNKETPQRLLELITLSEDMISGRRKGEKMAEPAWGLDLVVQGEHVSIRYTQDCVQ